MVRGKAPILIDLPLPLELRSKKKQESIYRALREAILTGMLAKGNPLPSTRSLAQRWQVARGTVEAAFDRLRMEGYVTRKDRLPELVVSVHGSRQANCSRNAFYDLAPVQAAATSYAIGYSKATILLKSQTSGQEHVTTFCV